jgi:hypothetical protein
MKLRIVIGIFAALSLLGGTLLQASASQDQFAGLRAATAAYHNPNAAVSAGYGEIEGLDHCFYNPGVGGMGYHLINGLLIDLNVDMLQPEAMVYVPGPQGLLQLGAVEYIVPAEPWDDEYSDPPFLFGKSFDLNSDLGVYILHVWIWRHNPAGILANWNPTVTCP